MALDSNGKLKRFENNLSNLIDEFERMYNVRISTVKYIAPEFFKETNGTDARVSRKIKVSFKD